jgi:hypothetical protein
VVVVRFGSVCRVEDADELEAEGPLTATALPLSVGLAVRAEVLVAVST